MMKDASVIPYAWGFHVGLDGFAKFLAPYSWVLPLINIPQVIFGRLGMDWSQIERITYLYPLLILLFFAPIVLFRTIFQKNKFYLISVIVFSFNTYALLLAGGEIFVALAYFLIPLILAIFIKIINNTGNQTTRSIYAVVAGLLVSLQIIFDPRVTYVTLSAVVLYGFIYLASKVNRNTLTGTNIKRILSFFIFVAFIPGLVAFFLNEFWILSTIFYGVNPVESLGVGYSSVGAVQFLSFAKLENTISLLHPNWPENIFGKVYFMRPEFLLFPILAFLALFFIKRNQNTKEKTYILFFALLGLIGAFLSKGSNDPFGGIYLWMFNHVPGFIMFRDPAKWYPLVAVSYSILIPFTVWKTYELLKSRSQFSSKFRIFNLQNLFMFLVLGYMLFLIRPAVFGQLGGMFKPTIVPEDYVRLEKFLVNKPNYFRTLWMPSKQRFGYYSNNHPEMSAQVLFNVTDNQSLFKKLSEENTEKLLQEASIKYVIIPYDSEKEIFLTDRKYDNLIYLQTLRETQKIPWLKQVASFGKIIVFAVPNPKGHFWSPYKNLSLTYRYISPVAYEVNVRNTKKGNVVIFAESYDSKWVAKYSGFTVQSSKFDDRFNSFVLPTNGSYSLKVYYTSQDYVNIGLIISVVTLVISVSSLIVLVIKKK